MTEDRHVSAPDRASEPQIPTRTVSLWGASQAGKTTALATLSR